VVSVIRSLHRMPVFSHIVSLYPLLVKYILCEGSKQRAVENKQLKLASTKLT